MLLKVESQNVRSRCRCLRTDHLDPNLDTAPTPNGTIEGSPGNVKTVIICSLNNELVRRPANREPK